MKPNTLVPHPYPKASNIFVARSVATPPTTLRKTDPAAIGVLCTVKEINGVVLYRLEVHDLADRIEIQSQNRYDPVEPVFDSPSESKQTRRNKKGPSLGQRCSILRKSNTLLTACKFVVDGPDLWDE